MIPVIKINEQFNKAINLLLEIPNNNIDYLVIFLSTKNYQEELTITFNRNKRSQFKEAIELFSSIIAIDTNHFLSYEFRGLANFHLGNWLLAIDDFNQLMTILPRYYFSYEMKGKCYKSINQIESAIGEYNNLILLKPTISDYYHDRGNLKFEISSKIDDGFLEDFYLAIKLDPQNNLFYNNRGRTYLTYNENELAVADFKKAIELSDFYISQDVNNKEIHYYRKAWALYKLKLFKMSIESIDLAIFMNPKVIHYLELKAEIIYKSEINYEYKRGTSPRLKTSFNNVIDIYNNIISLDLENDNGYQRIIVLHIESRDYEKALKVIENYSRFNPNYDYYYQEWECYFKLCRINEAINTLNEGMKKYPDNMSYIFAFGRSYDYLKEYEKAIFYYNKYIDNSNDNYFAYHYLQKLLLEYLDPIIDKTYYYYSISDYKNAIVLFERCLDYNFNLDDVLLDAYFSNHIKKDKLDIEYKEQVFNQINGIVDYNNKIKYYDINSIMSFGKYKNQSISEIIEKDHKYLLWCIINLQYFQFNRGLILNKIFRKDIDYSKAIVHFLVKSEVYDSNRIYENQYNNDDDDTNSSNNSVYGGIYGCSDDTIDDCFDGDPDNYWNID